MNEGRRALRALATAATAVAVAVSLAAHPGSSAQAAESAYVVVVAPTGTRNADDAGPGNLGRPLATLGEAQSRARALAERGDRDVEVRLLDGTYRLEAPLRFDAADSGRGGRTVTWTAAPKASPVITGATAVTGWELDDEEAGIYRADVGTGFDTRQLYVDGVVAQKARLSLPRTAISLNADGFEILDQGFLWLGDLPAQDRIEFQALLSFTNRFTPVASIEGDVVTLQQPAWDNNTYGYDTVQSPLRTPTFFLLNSKAFLDEPGEWYLDTESGVLYYKPLEGQDMSTAQVELPRLETLVEVGGTYDEPATGLRFHGLTFTGTTWLHPSSPNGYANQQTGVFIDGVQPERPDDAFQTCNFGCRGFEGSRNGWSQTPAAVQVSAAHDIVISGSRFVNLGSIGIGVGNDANAHSTEVGLGAQGVSVVGNTLTANAGGGIVVGGVRPDAHHPSDMRMTNKDIAVTDNRVYATSLEYLDHDAILATYVTGLTIAHNYVSDMPYTGIGLGYGWGANDVGGSPEYMSRGLYDFQPVYDTPTTLRDVTMVGNHVRNVVQRMFDAGCIYTLSAIPDSFIDRNLCENSGQLGLYFDEGSRYITARQNVLLNTAGQWAHANNIQGPNTGNLTLIGNWSTNPAITGLVHGSRGNVVQDNVTVVAENLPIEASRVVYEAGPRGAYRDDAGRSPMAASLTADPGTVGGGESARLELTLANVSGDARVTGVEIELDLPEGWQADPIEPAPRPYFAPGDTASQSWDVTAPSSVPDAVSRAELVVSVRYQVRGVPGEISRTATVTALNPVTAMLTFGSVPSQFAESDGRFVIVTAGADIWEDASGAFDDFGAIYVEDVAGASSVITARVERMDNTNPWAKAGVVIRNDVSGAAESQGYAVMVVTPGNGVAFQRDSDGDGYLDSFSGVGGIRAPVWVRLVRTEDQVAGYYSTNGSVWSKVGPTVTLPGLESTADAGLIATSHASGVYGQFDFSGFTVD